MEKVKIFLEFVRSQIPDYMTYNVSIDTFLSASLKCECQVWIYTTAVLTPDAVI